MMWLTKLEQLADPKYGLTVKFESGWKRRGASGGAQMKTVAGALWHHDVAPRKGTYPLRAMLRDGRAGLSGPLAHIGFDRDGVVHVIGAGKANHAGTGSVPGVVRNGGNTRLLGIEMTSAGTRPWDWTPAQLREMPKLGAALGDIFGYGPAQNWGHYEYSDGGKIDPAGLPGAMPGLRSRIAAVRFGSVPGPGTSAPSSPADPAKPWTTSPRVNAMSAAEVRAIQSELVDAGYSVGSHGIDGSYGDGTGTAVQQIQTDLGLTADGVWGPTTQEALMTLKTDIAKLQKDVTRIIAFSEQIHWRVDARLPQQINGAQAAAVKAIQETGKAQGLTDAQVQQIAAAAAAAAARVSAEDVAAQLEVSAKSAG